jgi:hypothetical protein
MGPVLCALFCALVLFAGAQRSERGKQVVVGRKGGRVLVLVSLDGAITALNPDDGKKKVRVAKGLCATVTESGNGRCMPTRPFALAL